MQYSPKLKKAATEINQILAKYDIAGLIFLHTPGHGEYIIKLNPSYSCATVVDEGIRIRSKLSDFEGDKSKHEKVLTDTSNMLNIMSEMSGTIVMGMMEVSEKLDKLIEAKHFGDGHTSHTQQNN